MPVVSQITEASEEAPCLAMSLKLEMPVIRELLEMTGRAQIDTGKRRMLEVLTRRMIRYVRIEFWSWW